MASFRHSNSEASSCIFENQVPSGLERDATAATAAIATTITAARKVRANIRCARNECHDGHKSPNAGSTSMDAIAKSRRNGVPWPWGLHPAFARWHSFAMNDFFKGLHSKCMLDAVGCTVSSNLTSKFARHTGGWGKGPALTKSCIKMENRPQRSQRRHGDNQASHSSIKQTVAGWACMYESIPSLLRLFFVAPGDPIQKAGTAKTSLCR